jgi:hypothetical protein
MRDHTDFFLATSPSAGITFDLLSWKVSYVRT